MSDFRCTECFGETKPEADHLRCQGCGAVFEEYLGRWRRVVDGSRSGWWRFNEHYDRNGYCDNPARGY